LVLLAPVTLDAIHALLPASALGECQAEAIKLEIEKIEKPSAQLLERIIDTTVPSVIAAHEQRISKHAGQKAMLKEKSAEMGRPANTFEDTLRTALNFLAKP